MRIVHSGVLSEASLGLVPAVIGEVLVKTSCNWKIELSENAALRSLKDIRRMTRAKNRVLRVALTKTTLLLYSVKAKLHDAYAPPTEF